MRQYDHNKIERKWQKEWEKKRVYRSKEGKGKKKAYVLDMFPYPSGDGLHVGHPKGYIATDIFSRHARMQGKSVLHPMGWDAFGLPAENYAIKNKVHPRKAVEKNVKRFKEQLKLIGLDYDWSREINTTDPEFYKWTQWIFLKLYEKGLAYQSFEPINWCPSCQTGLANEDLEGNACERCGTIVEKRPMRQWVLKITDYAERLLQDLNLLPEWQEHIKESQRNWIGKSEGAEIDFGLDLGKKYKYVYLHGYKSGADRPRNHWYRKNLEALGHSVVIPELPNTNHPKESEQVEAAINATELDENTILVGHSLGGIVAMKALLKTGKKVAGLVLIAPAMDPESMAKAPKSHTGRFSGKKPFDKTFDWNIDYEKVKSLTKYTTVLSDLQENHRAGYLRELAKKLDARLVETRAADEHFTADKEPDVLMWLRPTIRVFTTRPDTLFGATFLTLSPEHPWVQLAIRDDHKGVLKNQAEVRKYAAKAAEKTEIERTAEGKEKTGVKLEGVEAINPATGEKIPVFVADYVLAGYGTGAIMGVPAHDERDHDFAKKFNVPIKQVVKPIYVDKINPPRDGVATTKRNGVIVLIKHWSEDKYLLNASDTYNWRILFTGGVENGEDPIEAAKREVLEETGYKNIKAAKVIPYRHVDNFFRLHKGDNAFVDQTNIYVELADGEQVERSEEEKAMHQISWKTKEEMLKAFSHDNHKFVFEHATNGGLANVWSGVLINSGEFDALSTEEAKKQMTEQFGVKKTTYRIRDWVFSRQRYWGEPIPLIHCEKCGVVPVPEKDLPVKLPDVKNYAPTGTGESPLAAIDKWVNVKCPKCKGKAKRETNTMPQWAGSSWYWLRYMDPKNKKALVDKKKEKYWAPVDLYVGGAEHATRHLIYGRFWHKFLYDLKIVSTKEPFTRLISVGLILAEDGRKMSKRFGNVINPDDMVKQYGADTLRVYEMFMGPFTDAIAWKTSSLIGARRFLERIWRMQERLAAKPNPDVERALHQTTRKVSEDIKNFKFNTAISQMMILVNEAEAKGITKKQYLTLITLLAPFAPHIAEEIWRTLGNKKTVHLEKWPKFNAKKAAAESVTYAIQINGKVRTEINTPAGAAQTDVEPAARTAAGKWLEGKVVKKVIFVPNRLISFVVEE